MKERIAKKVMYGIILHMGFMIFVLIVELLFYIFPALQQHFMNFIGATELHNITSIIILKSLIICLIIGFFIKVEVKK